MRSARSLPIAAALALSLAASAAWAGAWMPERGEYYSELVGAHAASRNFFDPGGDRAPFAYGGALERHTLRVYNEVGWRKWACLILGAPATSVTRRRVSPFAERTVTELGDLDLGLRLRMIQGRTALAVQVDWTAPLGYQIANDSTADVPRVAVSDQPPPRRAGDGVPRRTGPELGLGRQAVTEQLLFGTALPGLATFVELAGGYRFWTQRYGIQLLGSARVGTWLGPSLLVSGHYESVVAHAGAELADYEFDAITVGPELRYRVDDRLDLIAGSNHTAAGKNWVHSDEYYVGMAFRQTRLDRLQGDLGKKSRR